MGDPIATEPAGAPDRSGGRVVAFDLGSRRIGVAVTDSARTMALPHCTVTRSRDTARDRRTLIDLVVDLDASLVVVGLPLSLDGSAGPAARSASAEAEALAEGLREHEIRVELFDERLSTVSAHRSLAEGGLRERERRRVVDETAAAVLLDSWLEGAEPRR